MFNLWYPLMPPNPNPENEIQFLIIRIKNNDSSLRSGRYMFLLLRNTISETFNHDSKQQYLVLWISINKKKTTYNHPMKG